MVKTRRLVYLLIALAAALSLCNACTITPPSIELTLSPGQSATETKTVTLQEWGVDKLLLQPGLRSGPPAPTPPPAEPPLPPGSEPPIVPTAPPVVPPEPPWYGCEWVVWEPYVYDEGVGPYESRNFEVTYCVPLGTAIGDYDFKIWAGGYVGDEWYWEAYQEVTIHVVPPSVGGELCRENKLSILAPWLGLGLILALAIGGRMLSIRRRRTH